MPLIRYRIGDRGFLLDEPCACGRTWPRLGAVSGRVSDQFRTRDGRLVHGNFICYLMYYSEWIERYQIVQKELDRVVLRVQPHSWSADLVFRPAGFEREVVEYIREGMGHDMRVDFEYLPRLEAGASGKFRYVVCELEDEA
jgi:phenylacetate-CoA ligase